ncbi:MAG: hypothetical protein M1829_003693 [Trizodia sp. TS-e1964]|nr:MAG: hypothetical protein M1829_003693 [Trizodia sp. TS-e1964]
MWPSSVLEDIPQDHILPHDLLFSSEAAAPFFTEPPQLLFDLPAPIETILATSWSPNPGPISSAEVPRDRDSIIAKIESIIGTFFDAFLEEKKEICLELKGQTIQEAQRFTIVVRILGYIHEALINDTITTKRDIYYKDVELFGRQSIVDKYVDDIAYTFNVERESLNVSLFNLENDISRLQPPRDLSLDLSQLAKGYPDISTRAFLRTLSTYLQANSFPPVSSYGLMDYDPDGLSILSTYKYGSAALAHENARLSMPQIRWLGVRSSDIKALSMQGEDYGLLRLSGRDRRMAASLLGKEVFAENGPEPDWRSEVQTMLMLNIKAEIQIMHGGQGKMALNSWIEERLTEGTSQW